MVNSSASLVDESKRTRAFDGRLHGFSASDLWIDINLPDDGRSEALVAPSTIRMEPAALPAIDGSYLRLDVGRAPVSRARVAKWALSRLRIGAYRSDNEVPTYANPASALEFLPGVVDSLVRVFIRAEVAS